MWNLRSNRRVTDMTPEGGGTIYYSGSTIPDFQTAARLDSDVCGVHHKSYAKTPWLPRRGRMCKAGLRRYQTRHPEGFTVRIWSIRTGYIGHYGQ
jgi:hypothetical protein